MLPPIPPEPMQEKIVVVIPMYRVAGRIQQVIRGLPEWVWRVVAVDDASPDDSAQKAAELHDPRVVILRHERNQGVGGAVLTGLDKAVELGATVMVKMDGDNQMPPQYLPEVVRPILEGRADYVKGNRFMHTADISHMPQIRRVGNTGLSFLAKLASGYWNVFDPTNGYVAIDAGVYRELEKPRIHRRYFFESSMLIELNLQRAVVMEVSMPAFYAGEASSLSIPQVLFEFPVLLTRGFFRRVWLQYFMLDFSAGSLFLLAGGLLALFGLVWGVIKWRVSILSGIPASTGTVMLAVVPLILGAQLLLQALVLDVQNVPRAVRSRLAALRARRSTGQ